MGRTITQRLRTVLRPPDDHAYEEALVELEIGGMFATRVSRFYLNHCCRRIGGPNGASSLCHPTMASWCPRSRYRRGHCLALRRRDNLIGPRRTARNGSACVAVGCCCDGLMWPHLGDTPRWL